jgi:transposase
MSRETRKVQITHLLANPGLSHQQIATAVGVSTKTVQRVAKEIKPDVAEVDAKLTEYQTLLRKRLPIKDRVELYDKIARKADSNPFAAMRALERADELDGIITAKDQAREQESAPQQAMFVLPGDAKIQLNIGCQLLSEPQANVTPEKDK